MSLAPYTLLTRPIVAAITSLINQIDSLCPNLPKSIPKAPANGEIRRILTEVHGHDTGAAAHASTFVRRMDLLFGVSIRNAEGRMTYVQRGKAGIPLVVEYWRSIDWQADGVPLAPATVKLTQVLNEMQYLWCVTSSIWFLNTTNAHLPAARIRPPPVLIHPTSNRPRPPHRLVVNAVLQTRFRTTRGSFLHARLSEPVRVYYFYPVIFT